MITSTSNARVKEVINLKKKASERKAKGLFIVEGERVVREIPKGNLAECYVSESFAKAHDTLALCDGSTLNLSTDVEVVSDRVFETMADTMSPQGVLAVVRKLVYRPEEILTVLPGESPVYLLLEHIQDPGNLGTMMRTAEGAGVKAVILSSDTVDLYNPKVTRATMGSLFRVPFLYIEDFLVTMKGLQTQGVKLCAAHLKGEKNYFEEDFSGPVGFLIGNEGNGLTDEASDLADCKVKIPMEGKLESLNAAVSAALFMYEAKRQR